MSEYNLTFNKIIENFDSFELGTIIENENGQRYKLTKTDNDNRKFSRINRGLRFMTYDNMNKMFRIIEEQQDINIQSIEEIPKILFLGTEKNDLMKVLNDIIDNQNLQLQAVKQLDKKMEEKNNGIK